MSCQHEHTHGNHNHNHDHDHTHVPPIPTNQSQSLLPKINLDQVTALNISNPATQPPQIFRTQSNKYKLSPCLTSDADEQIILNIPFTGNVKLYSLIIRSDGDSCPKDIKLFKNTDLDFDNCENKATYSLVHPHVGHIGSEGEDDVDAEDQDESQFIEHYLPRHLFANVHKLSIFFSSVYGDEDVSKVYYIELRGEWSEFTKGPKSVVYESAANPADHAKVEEVRMGTD